MKTRYLIGFFVVLMVCGMASVIYFGIQPRPVPKITVSVFANSEVVVNSVLLSIPNDLAKTPILFFGIDPQDAFQIDVMKKFIAQNQTYPASRFDGFVMDEAFPADTGIQAERFSLRGEPERFADGIHSVLEKKLRLMVIVPQPEASSKLAGSLNYQIQHQFGLNGLTTGLVFTNFPRRRDDESKMNIPCNTGEEDRGGIASLGCMIVQKARGLYRKRFPSGTRVGLLDQVGTNDFVFLLAIEP